MRERGQSPAVRTSHQEGDVARYAESGGRDKIATLVRVIETQTP